MTDKFDIIEYLSGLTGFVFDKAVLKRIAIDRHVIDAYDYCDIDDKTKELLLADLLYTAYLSPNVWASSTSSHGSFSNTIGSQTMYASEKDRLYNSFIRIYKKYNDDKLEECKSLGSTLQWLDE